MKKFRLSLVVLTTFVVLEVSVRYLGLAPPLTPQYSYFVEDPLLPYRTAPDQVFAGRSATDEYDFHYRHNSRGFRDVEHDLEKSDGVFRILGLGDSYTYGAGAPFEQTYLRRLEQMLDATPDAPDVEIVNAGIPRYFPEPERLLLEHYGVKFRPDLILVGFVPNDVMDTYMGIDAVSADETGYLKTSEAAEIGRGGTFVYQRSHLLRIPLRAFINRRTRQKYRIDWAQVFEENGLYEEAWQKIEREYERMVEMARANGARIAIVHIPLGPRSLERIGTSNASYPAKRLAAWCEKRGVLFIDTLPAMTAAKEPAALHWEKDGHCTAEGHRIIAETIYEALIRTGAVVLASDKSNFSDFRAVAHSRK